MMLRAYPNRGKLEDGYIGTIAAVLCDYPRSVASRCADPAKGVARKSKWIPTVADVVAWCEPQMGSMQDIADFEARSEKQLRERKEFDARQREESPEHRAAVVDRIRREMAAAGLAPNGYRDKYDPRFTPAAFMERFGLSEAEFEALPNAPEPGQWERLQAQHAKPQEGAA